MSDPGGSGPNRTVFRPSPLQAAKAPAQGEPSLQPDSAPAATLGADDVAPPAQPAAIRNPMMARAAPLLALLASVRTGRARITLPELHAKASAELAEFEQSMRGRVSEEQSRRAVYALAATADDVALNLPDQASDAAEWARRSMVVRFFGENIGGDRFWRLLDEMVARPAEFPDLLELYHACMAAGFEGRYRVTADGKRGHQELMQRVYTAMEHPRRLSQTELSPHWRGQPTPTRRVGFWSPIALAAAAATLLLMLVYIVLRLILAQTGQPAMTALRAISPDQPLRLSRVAPSPPAPPPGARADHLRSFLAPEIADHLVTVVEDASTVRVRTTVGQLFQSGSDALVPERAALFDRIAQAIETEPGPVTVEGYTDSDKVHTVSFTDNVALSQARADAVAALVRKRLSKPERVSATGYGDAQPLAPNASAEGKSRNRRVEIVIQREGGAG